MRPCGVVPFVIVLAVATGCGAQDLVTGEPEAPDMSGLVTGTVMTVVMAADIAERGRTNYARDNASLIANHTPAVAAVVLGGDNERFAGLPFTSLLADYTSYYQPATQANFGQFDAIAFPGLGNHEYNEAGAKGYFDYFAARMDAIRALPTYHGEIATPGKAYYSFDLNGWHFVNLNSNCSAVVGGCAAGSPQELWLRDDLAAHVEQPIVAVWHAPRYACGGGHADDTDMQAFWADLVDAGADFVFNGHNHYYQRWQPLDKSAPEAALDATGGLAEIVAGSYGVSPHTVCTTVDARVAKQAGGADGMGVFFLTLGSDGSYAFEYRLRKDGSRFDSGGGTSHHRPKG